jgi:hypothetical protein
MKINRTDPFICLNNVGRMKFLILIPLVSLLVACSDDVRLSSFRGGPYFYSWANLYVAPSYPSEPITKEAAARREADGTGYYIAYFDEIGRLHSLEHRGGHHWIKETYFYKDRKLKRITTESDTGKISNREIK